MFAVKIFREQLVRSGYSQARLAKEIGMAASTLGKKVRRGNFGAEDALRIAAVLQLSDPAAVFFAEK